MCVMQQEIVHANHVRVDESLLNKASLFAGSLNRTAMIRKGLKALIERESATRLAGSGAS